MLKCAIRIHLPRTAVLLSRSIVLTSTGRFLCLGRVGVGLLGVDGAKTIYSRWVSFRILMV